MGRQCLFSAKTLLLIGMALSLLWIPFNSLGNKKYRPFLKDGTVKLTLLWNAPDHGYLTVYSAYRLLTEGLEVGKPYNVGRLGEFIPKKDEINMQVVLPVMIFTKENIDGYYF